MTLKLTYCSVKINQSGYPGFIKDMIDEETMGWVARANLEALSGYQRRWKTQLAHNDYIYRKTGNITINN